VVGSECSLYAGTMRMLQEQTGFNVPVGSAFSIYLQLEVSLHLLRLEKQMCGNNVPGGSF